MISELWIKEMLNLGHIKFSESKQLVSGRNLVSEAKTNLGSSKWYLTTIETKQLAKINEHTLSSLWSQVANLVTKRTNIKFEHEIEGFWVSDWVIVWTGDLKILEHFSEFLLVIDVSILSNKRKFLFLFFSHFLVLLDQLFNEFTQQLVSSVTLLGFLVFNHEVGEFFNMARSLENRFWGDTTGRYFKHILFKHEVFSPKLLHVVSDSTT